MNAATRVGVDVGGTFTDVILHRRDGARVRKLLSTPPSYDRAVVEAVAGARGRGEVSRGRARHDGRDERRARAARRRTALVTTAGFRDVLELRRMRMPHMYDLFWRKPPPLVQRRLRFEVSERVTADGTVLRPLDEDECRALAARLRATGVESVAVCLLHSYRYPEHEQRLGALLPRSCRRRRLALERDPARAARVRAHRDDGRQRLRAAADGPYVDRIRTGLDGIGVAAPLMIMQSSGGVMTADDAGAARVRARVGPGGGRRRRARDGASSSASRNVIAFDMGGTTAKASLIEDGASRAAASTRSAARSRPAAG